MMQEMQAKVLGWIGRDSPLVADNIIPPVATLPDPKPPTDEDQKLAVIAEAHVFVEQLRQERATDRQIIEQLRLELGETFVALQAEQRKSGLLELDIVQMANDKQTLQTDLLEKDRCLSLLRQVLDKFGTKAPPKKVRTPRPKKKSVSGNRESTDQTAKADG